MLILDPDQLSRIFNNDEIEVLKDFPNRINPHLLKVMKKHDFPKHEMSAYAQHRFSKAGLKKQYIRDKIDDEFKNHNMDRKHENNEAKKNRLKNKIKNLQNSLAVHTKELNQLLEPTIDTKNAIKKSVGKKK